MAKVYYDKDADLALLHAAIVGETLSQRRRLRHGCGSLASGSPTSDLTYSGGKMSRGGLVIREARRRSGVTQAKLARRLGTSQAAVWRWEAGVVEPPYHSVARAASACGLSLAPLLQDVDEDEWRLVELGRNRSPAERIHELERFSRFITAGRAAVRDARRHG